MVKKFKLSLASCIQFLQTDIWRIRASTLTGKKSFWLRQLRIILLAIRGFDEDNCQLRASSLTFFSLLSIVPVVAMAFGVAKGFGLQNVLEKLLVEKMQGQEEVVNKIIEFAHSFLDTTNGGLIAGIGIAFLFWTVIKVLGNIENAFNGIWGIVKPRPLGRKFSDYLSIMLVCPILLIMSSSATVAITAYVTLLVEKLAFLGPIGTLIIISLRILPYAVLWFMFTFIYIFMPNTKVDFKSGLFGGVIGGTVYQMVQWAYIIFQSGATKYGAIYGSFAALPLFLIWLQISWTVILFGAEISFAEQNVDTYEFEADSVKASNSFKRLLALNITQVCVQKFQNGERPLTASELSHMLEIPIRLIRQVIHNLTESGVLSEVKYGEDKTITYQPARDVSDLSILSVIDRMDCRGIDSIPVAQTKTLEALREKLDEFHKTISSSPANVLLKDIKT